MPGTKRLSPADARTARLQVTVTPAEAKYIRRLAEDEGLSVSDLIRAVMVGFV